MTSFFEKIDNLNPVYGLIIAAVVFVLILVLFVLYAARMSRKERKIYNAGIPPENLDLCDPPKREPVAEISPEQFDEDDYWSLMNMQG